MFILLASIEVKCGFESRSGQTKEYEIGICCFFSKQAAGERGKLGRVYPRSVLSVS
jgi:hypothetical protein